MEYLPTSKYLKNDPNVGKYSIHGASGYGTREIICYLKKKVVYLAFVQDDTTSSSKMRYAVCTHPVCERAYCTLMGINVKRVGASLVHQINFFCSEPLSISHFNLGIHPPNWGIIPLIL